MSTWLTCQVVGKPLVSEEHAKKIWFHFSSFNHVDNWGDSQSPQPHFVDNDAANHSALDPWEGNNGAVDWHIEGWLQHIPSWFVHCSSSQVCGQAVWIMMNIIQVRLIVDINIILGYFSHIYNIYIWFWDILNIIYGSGVCPALLALWPQLR